MNPGDIAFTGLNENTNSQFSFVSSKALSKGVTIYFTNYSYDTTVPGLVDESVSISSALAVTAADGVVASESTTVTEGTISYVVGSAGLSAYNQVVIGYTTNEPNLPQGGAVNNIAGAGGNTYLVWSNNGTGHKLLAYTVSAGVTQYIAGLIFGPDSWQTSGPIASGNFWDSYLPPGLSSTTSTDLSGYWNSGNFNNYDTKTTKNVNVVLDACQTSLAGIVNPFTWVGDGNANNTHVALNTSNTSTQTGLGITACSAGTGGYSGTLYSHIANETATLPLPIPRLSLRLRPPLLNPIRPTPPPTPPRPPRLNKDKGRDSRKDS